MYGDTNPTDVDLDASPGAEGGTRQEQLAAAMQEQLARQEHEIANLHIALRTSRTIGIAIGILMSSAKITRDDAFRRLSQTSQLLGRKLVLVADYVVDTGGLPDVGVSRRAEG
jgi:AmiR/NasT family two-component response regulator